VELLLKQAELPVQLFQLVNTANKSVIATGSLISLRKVLTFLVQHCDICYGHIKAGSVLPEAALCNEGYKLKAVPMPISMVVGGQNAIHVHSFR
jgi:hypothetical protein